MVFFLKKIFIHWLYLVLGYSMWNLLIAAYGIQFPDQGWNPGPLPWEYRILATGPPGKSLDSLLIEELETQ